MIVWIEMFAALASPFATSANATDVTVAPVAWRAVGAPYSVDLVVGEVDSRVLLGSRFRLRLGILQGSGSDTQTVFRDGFESPAALRGAPHD